MASSLTLQERANFHRHPVLSQNDLLFIYKYVLICAVKSQAPKEAAILSRLLPSTFRLRAASCPMTSAQICFCQLPSGQTALG